MAIEDAVIQAVAKKFEKDESEVTRETALKELGGDDLDHVLAEAALRDEMMLCARLSGWKPARTEKISSGFYTSQAMELVMS